METNQFNESEFKKFIQQVKFELQSLCQGVDIQKNTEKIIEYYISAPNRLTKLLCYSLLKSLPNIDLQQIFSSISQDLISKDNEIQLNTMKLMYMMGHQQALEILKNNEKQFFEILKNSEFHFERIAILHSFLIKAYIKNFSSEDNCIEQIHQIYIAIAEQIFEVNRDITRNSIEVFLYINSKIKSLFYFQQKKVTNYLMQRIESLINKVIGYEIRLRSHLIKLPVFLIEIIVSFSKTYSHYTYTNSYFNITEEDLIIKNKYEQNISLNSIYTQLLEKNLLEDLLKSTFEQDVLINSYTSFFRLLFLGEKLFLSYHKRCNLIWEIFSNFVKVINKSSYKKEYNIILINMSLLALKTQNTHKIAISMKILEIVSSAGSLSNQYSRFFLMKICFYNLISASVFLLQQNKQSCIFSLFNQKWFYQKLQSDDENNQKIDQQQIKEELLISLIVSALYFRLENPQKIHQQAQQQVFLEILDISYRIINWKYQIKQSPNDTYNKTINLSIDLYLVLLEESFESLNVSFLVIRLNELIKRINLSEINFFPKIKLLYLICKKYSSLLLNNNLEQINYNLIIQDFQNFLNQKCSSSIFFEKASFQEINRFLTCFEYIFKIFFFFQLKFPLLKEIIMNYLLNFRQQLDQLLVSKQKQLIFQPIINAIIEHTNLLQKYILEEEEEQLSLKIDSNLKISRDFLENTNTEFEKNENPMKYISFNNLCQTSQKNSEDEKQMELSNANLNLFTNPILITGINDFIQIMTSHSIFPYKNLLSINLRIFNSTQFKLDNLKIKIIHSNSLSLFPINSSANPSEILIEELNPINVKNLSFCLNVNQVESLFITFEIQLLNDIIFKTIPYKVPLIHFLIPNYINILSKNLFLSIYSSLPSLYQTKAYLYVKLNRLIKILNQSQFSAFVIEGMDFQTASEAFFSQKKTFFCKTKIITIKM
ncbi:hypothetical protein IMG5_147360 [Ichthyophthirius multifiliis]|uniref:Uncharacterized protein n=1 Tax=Ichthyophthirius multifiliis TaxID=5932 RepID=G0QY49_ICHMU|nr:hypothetical protein IMG5_147360 [Ichthyophthirius multifiliis]EGR29855.1 hypothetical protein IMG5_147360 [Ichthyophthirius multifiliis]|eukprot:XP_004031091.1 hypothetical protein IMG5_147360 [Ichthyophthirius multifiliis]